MSSTSPLNPPAQVALLVNRHFWQDVLGKKAANLHHRAQNLRGHFFWPLSTCVSLVLPQNLRFFLCKTPRKRGSRCSGQCVREQLLMLSKDAGAKGMQECWIQCSSISVVVIECLLLCRPACSRALVSGGGWRMVFGICCLMFLGGSAPGSELYNLSPFLLLSLPQLHRDLALPKLPGGALWIHGVEERREVQPPIQGGTLG